MSNNKKNNNAWVFKLLVILMLLTFFKGFLDGFFGAGDDRPEYDYNDKTFYIIASSDNMVLNTELKEFAKKNKIDIKIDYSDTLDIIEKLNSGEKYDAILISNSMWLSKLDSNVVKTSSLRSTSITPIIFGIKEAKAESLGFKNKKVYTSDILKEIKNGNLKFSMANPLTTNSGASAYLELLINLSGNPEVLTLNHLKNEKLKEEMVDFFTGIERTSGDENFLETSFVSGDYDAAFTYESSIININKELKKQGKETLYAVYPVDGVAIADSPFVYIDNKNEKKKDTFDSIQSFLLSEEGKKVLLENGRRTWYGGINNNAPEDLFNPEWGINTKEYITPVKYPSMAVINEALALYQTEFRKPVHVVFCLDYTGSMSGDGIIELRDAMKFVLTSNDLTVNFNEKDKIDIIPFGSTILNHWSTDDGYTKEDLLELINNQELDGSTALHPAASRAVEILSHEDRNKYVSSVILMTDGQGNVGSFKEFANDYRLLKTEIPVYSITFGYADEDELLEISNFTNGKVFDGKTNLQLAFKKVRGYN